MYKMDGFALWQELLMQVFIAKCALSERSVEESSNCEFDFLHIETPLGSKTFCGLRNPFKRIVNTTRITLTFQSDRSVSRPGFQIDYSVIGKRFLCAEVAK